MAQFATSDELATYLGIDIASGNDEDRGELCLQLASAAIQNWTGQRIELVEDDAIVLDGKGTDLILLPEVPVIEIASVKTGGPDFDTELDADVDYVWYPDGIVRRQPVWSRWDWLRQDVEVTYTHGYAASTADIPNPNPLGISLVPDDIKAVCLRVAAKLYKQPGVFGTLQQEQMGDHSYTMGTNEYAMSLLDEEKMLLARYRIRELV